MVAQRSEVRVMVDIAGVVALLPASCQESFQQIGFHLLLGIKKGLPCSIVAGVLEYLNCNL